MKKLLLISAITIFAFNANAQANTCFWTNYGTTLAEWNFSQNWGRGVSQKEGYSVMIIRPIMVYMQPHKLIRNKDGSIASYILTIFDQNRQVTKNIVIPHLHTTCREVGQLHYEQMNSLNDRERRLIIGILQQIAGWQNIEI